MKSLIIYMKDAKINSYGDVTFTLTTRVYDGDISEALDAAGEWQPEGSTVVNTIPLRIED